VKATLTSGELRLVSLLPSATEMACALGLIDQLLGVTHCCDYPPGIRSKPQVVHSNLPTHELGSSELDARVRIALSRGESLYHLDEQLLDQLAPTHVLTQDLCQVGAASGTEVSRALNTLRHQPQVLFMSPHSLSDIQENLRDLGRATGRLEEAGNQIASWQSRLRAVASRLSTVSRPLRVFCAEWVEPIYCSGHWVPEMVEMAGGIDPLGRKGADSIRVDWEAVRAAEPEVIVLMPCGYDAHQAQQQAVSLWKLPGWSELSAVRNRRVFAVDGGYFSRPGPRVIDGTEILAHLFHPDRIPWRGSADAFVRIENPFQSRIPDSAGRVQMEES